MGPFFFLVVGKMRKRACLAVWGRGGGGKGIQINCLLAGEKRRGSLGQCWKRMQGGCIPVMLALRLARRKQRLLG